MLAHAGRRSRHLNSRVQQTPGHRPCAGRHGQHRWSRRRAGLACVAEICHCPGPSSTRDPERPSLGGSCRMCGRSCGRMRARRQPLRVVARFRERPPPRSVLQPLGQGAIATHGSSANVCSIFLRLPPCILWHCFPYACVVPGNTKSQKPLCYTHAREYLPNISPRTRRGPPRDAHATPERGPRRARRSEDGP